MTNNLRLFLLAVLASTSFVWGINILEDNLKYFYFPGEDYRANFAAQADQRVQIEPATNETETPFANKTENETFNIDAGSAISVWVSSSGEDAKKILFEKS